jgi:hypothetical protein
MLGNSQEPKQLPFCLCDFHFALDFKDCRVLERIVPIFSLDDRVQFCSDQDRETRDVKPKQQDDNGSQ